jgi:hypothetical protein
MELYFPSLYDSSCRLGEDGRRAIYSAIEPRDWKRPAKLGICAQRRIREFRNDDGDDIRSTHEHAAPAFRRREKKFAAHSAARLRRKFECPSPVAA